MREPQAKAIHLKDYAPPSFRVDSIELDVDIREDHALVKSRLAIRRNSAGALVLDGDELELVSVALDGKVLEESDFSLTPEKLTIPGVPDQFTLETVSRIVPQKNTRLEGLYATKHGFVTQCEAEGFRRITWFIDRPMSWRGTRRPFTPTQRSTRCCFPTGISRRVAASQADATSQPS